MKDCIVKVSKVQFDYWYEKGSLGEVVKLVGDVSVLVQKKDWEEYRGNVETFVITDANYFPTKMIEIAIHENYIELQEKFDGC